MNIFKNLTLAVALLAICQPVFLHTVQLSKHQSEVFNTLYKTINHEFLSQEEKTKRVSDMLAAQDLSTVINNKHASGQTLLHVAADWGYRDILILLVANGSDLNKTNDKDENKTPLDYASENFSHHNAHNFLEEAITFFSKGKEPFHAFIKERLNKKSLETMLTLAAARDKEFAYRFYDTICNIFDKEKRKDLGCGYENVKYFYLDIAKAACNAFKTKWFLWCCELCNCDVFRTNGWTGEFEAAVKDALKALDDKTYHTIKKTYDSQILPGRNRYQAKLNKNFTDVKIVFEE